MRLTRARVLLRLIWQARREPDTDQWLLHQVERTIQDTMKTERISRADAIDLLRTRVAARGPSRRWDGTDRRGDIHGDLISLAFREDGR